MPLMENWNSPLQPLTNAPDCTISLKRGSGPGDWIRRLLATRTSCNANGLVHESIEPAKWKHRRHSPELYPGSIPLALQYCHIIFVLSTWLSILVAEPNRHPNYSSGATSITPPRCPSLEPNPQSGTLRRFYPRASHPCLHLLDPRLLSRTHPISIPVLVLLGSTQRRSLSSP